MSSPQPLASATGTGRRLGRSVQPSPAAQLGQERDLDTEPGQDGHQPRPVGESLLAQVI